MGRVCDVEFSEEGERPNEGCLHLLALAQWAVDQAMMPEAGEYMVIRLHQVQKKNPALVFRILTGESSDGSEVTLAELPPTLEEAAWAMVEQVLSEP